MVPHTATRCAHRQFQGRACVQVTASPRLLRSLSPACAPSTLARPLPYSPQAQRAIYTSAGHPRQGQCETTLSILLHPGSIKRDEQTRKRWVGQDKGLRLDRLTRWPPEETVSSRVLGTADLGNLEDSPGCAQLKGRGTVQPS